MVKKTIKYIDYNGVDREEDFYFNINETEMADMEFGSEQKLSDKITKMIAAKDQAKLIKMFKEFILAAYGEKSEDGRRFIKGEEISKAFSQTEAFNKLYMELATNDQLAADFINSVLPNDNPNVTHA